MTGTPVFELLPSPVWPITAIGRWSMLDVFLLAILVAHLKLGDIATVVPGPGIVAFTGVVILTMLASASFDPHHLWEAPRSPRAA